jgi:hypothetical protein
MAVPARSAGGQPSDLRSLLFDLRAHAPKLHDFRAGSKGADVKAHLRRLLTSDFCPLRPFGPLGRLARPGDHSAREPPDPIPNSAVKPCCAQGTALRRVGERVVARPGEASKRPEGPQRSEVRWSEGRATEIGAQRAKIEGPRPRAPAARRFAAAAPHDSLPTQRPGLPGRCPSAGPPPSAPRLAAREQAL